MANIIFWVLNIIAVALVLLVGLNGRMSGLYAIIAGNFLVLASFAVSIIHRARNSDKSAGNSDQYNHGKKK